MSKDLVGMLIKALDGLDKKNNEKYGPLILASSEDLALRKQVEGEMDAVSEAAQAQLTAVSNQFEAEIRRVHSKPPEAHFQFIDVGGRTYIRWEEKK